MRDYIMPSPPPSPYSAKPHDPRDVIDLSRQMSEHSLQQSKRPYTPLSTALPTPPNEFISPTSSFFSSQSPFDTTAFSDLSSPISLVTLEAPRRTPSPASPSTYHSSNVRRSRQSAIRAQCCPDHLREISELVARMVQEGDQCTITPTSEPSPMHSFFPGRPLHEDMAAMEIDGPEQAKEQMDIVVDDAETSKAVPAKQDANYMSSPTSSTSRDNRPYTNRQRQDTASRGRITKRKTT